MTEHKSIGIGILGFAHGHVHAYCSEWRENTIHHVKVVSGWDHDLTRLKAAEDAHHFQAASSVQELLADPKVEAVIIASETSMHAELAEQAAAAGKAIVIQKPLALTMQEADRIVAAIERFQVPFTMAWQMRVDPQNIEMKNLLHSGKLGKVFMVRRRHALATHKMQGFEDMWHVLPELNRDIWADDAAHPIDFMQWLLGIPESVTAEMMSLHNPKVPMDNGVALFRYPQGPLAEVSCSFTCTAAENTTEIICEKGTIIQSFGDAPSSNIPTLGDKQAGLKWYSAETGSWTVSQTPSPPDHGVRIRGLAAPLAAFLHGKREAIATASEARTSLQMTLACYVSTAVGRRVKLDDQAVRMV